MTREARRSQNEVFFREVNERLEARALAKAAAAREAFEIICECALEECTSRITVDTRTYERVRAHAKRFILVPGHEDETIERIVILRPDGTYAIVEKHGVAGAIAEEEDPRS